MGDRKAYIMKASSGLREFCLQPFCFGKQAGLRETCGILWPDISAGREASRLPPSRSSQPPLPSPPIIAIIAIILTRKPNASILQPDP